MGEIIYYSGRGGIIVTSRRVSTRYKDEDINLIRHVRIGREPLLIAAGSGVGLALFALQSSDLLYLHEQIALLMFGIVLLAAGWSVASLKVGAMAFEKTILWASYPTVIAVRAAINAARAARAPVTTLMAIETDGDFGG